MVRLLDQPLADLLDIPTRAAGGAVRPEVEAFVARVAALAFTTASVAPPAATARALAANTPQGLLGAFADLLTVGHREPAPDPLADALSRGRHALASALEASGGVWRADEAQERLRVSRTTLLQWRNAGRVLALRLAGAFVYPAAQFAPPATDLESPRPYPAIAEVIAAARGELTPAELAGLLATPQPALAAGGVYGGARLDAPATNAVRASHARLARGPVHGPAHGGAGREMAQGVGGEEEGGEAGPGRPSRTGFQAIADGDGALVVALVRHVVTPPDAGAGEDPDVTEPSAREVERRRRAERAGRRADRR